MALPPHIPVGLKMLPHLIECAKAGRRTNYEELSKATGLEARMFSRPLAFIRDGICVNHNLPPITVLVEKKGRDNPSNSFNPSQLAKLTPAEYKALEEEMIQKVYDYPRWDSVMEGVREMFFLNEPAVR